MCYHYAQYGRKDSRATLLYPIDRFLMTVGDISVPKQ